jgi:hypothetical protein
MPKIGLDDIFMKWYDTVSTEILFASYAEYAKKVNERRPLSREDFGKWMTQLGCKPCRPYNLPIGEGIIEASDGDGRRRATPIFSARPWAYRLGDLDAARTMFCTAKNLSVDWPRDEGENQDPSYSADCPRDEDQYLD